MQPFQENFDLKESGRQARLEYLMQKSVATGNAEIDAVLEGGVEVGNFYAILGPAKNGKSTVLRCLGISLAKNFPVLYVNFEQTGRNIFSKLYSMIYGHSFREHVHTDPTATDLNIESMPDIPFYVAFWPEKLEIKAFNTTIKDNLLKSINFITDKDPEHRKPIIILENLSDCINDRINGHDNLTNVVTQTAQDIKNFAVFNNVAIFLAHHTAKIQGDEPTMDDVRDSKRVCDLAHSVFAAYVKIEKDPFDGHPKNVYKFKYIAGRGRSEPMRWNVKVMGINMTLEPCVYSPELDRNGKEKFRITL